MRALLSVLVFAAVGASVGAFVRYLYFAWLVGVDMWLLYVIEGAIAGAGIGIAVYVFTYLWRRRRRAA